MGIWGFTITEEFATAVVSLLPVIMLVGVVELHQFHKKSYELEEEINTQPLVDAAERLAAMSSSQLTQEGREKLNDAVKVLLARTPSVELWRRMSKAWLVAFVYMSVAELATLYWLGLPKSPSWIWLALFDAVAVLAGLTLLVAGHIMQMRERTRDREQAQRQAVEEALTTVSRTIAENFGRRRSSGVGYL